MMHSNDDPNDHSDDRFQNAPITEPHRATVDEAHGVVLSMAEEMANVLGLQPTDLKPLYHDIDLEMLERFVAETDRQEVRFVSHGVEVTLHGDGDVVFEPAEH